MYELVHSLPSLLLLFWATLYPLSTLDVAHIRKGIRAVTLHKFNVCIPKQGSLGGRLFIDTPCQQLSIKSVANQARHRILRITFCQLVL